MPDPRDRIESLDFAERWLGDGFRALAPVGGMGLVEVDMTRALPLVESLRARGIKATLNHVVVRAVALALSRHPAIHTLVAGTTRLRPAYVDIGLSVAGRTSYAPVMVIERADGKALPELSAEVLRRVPEVQAKEAVDLRNMRRIGWIIPFAFVRRFLLRLVYSSTAFRRKLAGTFQVTCLNVDVVAPLVLATSAGLGVGRVRDRVIAVDGAPAVRPTVILSCTFDHAAWDGAAMATLLAEIRAILEEGQLSGEV